MLRQMMFSLLAAFTKRPFNNPREAVMKLSEFLHTHGGKLIDDILRYYFTLPLVAFPPPTPPHLVPFYLPLLSYLGCLTLALEECRGRLFVALWDTLG